MDVRGVVNTRSRDGGWRRRRKRESAPGSRMEERLGGGRGKMRRESGTAARHERLLAHVSDELRMDDGAKVELGDGSKVDGKGDANRSE